MRIDTLAPDGSNSQQVKTDLETFIKQPGDKEKRPCGGCTLPCACSHSPTCTCGCSPHCSNAPQYLSSEREKYPVEPLIVPLVYALQTTRLCPPCWSCEGHVDGQGNLNRLPQVWFYSRSIFYPRMIAEYLIGLQASKSITNPWQVSIISPTPANVDVTFSLSPNVVMGTSTSLVSLQQDAQVIAQGLAAQMKQKAEQYLRQMPS